MATSLGTSTSPCFLRSLAYSCIHAFIHKQLFSIKYRRIQTSFLQTSQMNEPRKKGYQEIQLQKILTKLQLLLRTSSLVSFLLLKREPIAISSQFSNKTIFRCNVYNLLRETLQKNDDHFYINIMHRVRVSQSFSLPQKGEVCLKVSRRPRPKSTRIYNTRTNQNGSS